MTDQCRRRAVTIAAGCLIATGSTAGAAWAGPKPQPLAKPGPTAPAVASDPGGRGDKARADHGAADHAANKPAAKQRKADKAPPAAAQKQPDRGAADPQKKPTPAVGGSGSAPASGATTTTDSSGNSGRSAGAPAPNRRQPPTGAPGDDSADSADRHARGAHAGRGADNTIDRDRHHGRRVGHHDHQVRSAASAGGGAAAERESSDVTDIRRPTVGPAPVASVLRMSSGPVSSGFAAGASRVLGEKVLAPVVKTRSAEFTGPAPVGSGHVAADGDLPLIAFLLLLELIILGRRPAATMRRTRSSHAVADESLPRMPVQVRWN